MIVKLPKMMMTQFPGSIDAPRLWIPCIFTARRPKNRTDAEKKKDRIFEVRNVNNFELAEGDEVEFLLPSGRTVFESFLVLILPLLLFIVFYYIGKGIFGAESEGKNILCGLLGIANGFLIALFYKKLRGNQDMPVITRKC